MYWIESGYGSRLWSRFGVSTKSRQISYSRAYIFGIWIFISLILLVIFLHPLSLVKNVYYGSKVMKTISVLQESRNSTLGFQKIFVINLKSRTDRRDRMLLGATMSGLEIEFFEAVINVSDKAIPPNGNLDYPMGIKGCWRSHMDVLETIVNDNIASALILEDDISWDISVRHQFSDLAKAIHVLTHPTPQGTYLDPTWPVPHAEDRSRPVDIPLDTAVNTSTHSPYGDEWDMLWLGHCGAQLTDESPQAFPRGRVTWLDDSVPAHQWIRYPMEHVLVNQYPNHTRAVHHSVGNVCTFGYAVTQKMARRLLWHLGVRTMNAPIDLEYAQICEGRWTPTSPRCYTVEPPYFTMHRPAGSMALLSDIQGWSGFQEVDFTPNLRYSVMANIDNWVEGMPLVDIAPDDKMPAWTGNGQK